MNMVLHLRHNSIRNPNQTHPSMAKPQLKSKVKLLKMTNKVEHVDFHQGSKTR